MRSGPLPNGSAVSDRRSKPVEHIHILMDDLLWKFGSFLKGLGGHNFQVCAVFLKSVFVCRNLLMSCLRGAAAKLGRKGGKEAAKRGPDYFKQLQQRARLHGQAGARRYPIRIRPGSC